MLVIPYIISNSYKYKTTYSVKVDIDKFVERCIGAVRGMEKINYVSIRKKINLIEMDESGIGGEEVESPQDMVLTIKNPVPDVLRHLQDETNLKRQTIAKILIGSGRLEDVRNNPQKFIDVVAGVMKSTLRGMMLDGIKYERIGDMEFYKQEIFEKDEMTAFLNANAIEVSRSVYSHVVYDSETERHFAEQMELDKNVKLFLKLPDKFKIETPIGNYNPDWAVLIECDGEERLYFVIETKGTMDKDQLKFIEDWKIQCGTKHFEALKTGVKYRPASDYGEFKRSEGIGAEKL